MNPAIRFWNSESSAIENEDIYGEKWLRFTYENWMGRIGLWAMVKRKWFSNWYGKRMDAPASREKILPFIEKYRVNQDEFLEDSGKFKTFNEFFYRKLKPEARPVDPDEKRIIFPADGRHFAIADLSQTNRIYAKGQAFDLPALLGCSRLADQYHDGSMLISRLCPVDYHRFHFPISGTIESTMLINGSLFSVNPIALRKNISIFWENKRYISFIQNDLVGPYIQILIGATCVGSVHMSCEKNAEIIKGDEHGYFSFGGSCVISLFRSKTMTFRSELLEQSRKGYESYFKFGKPLGQMLN